MNPQKVSERLAKGLAALKKAPAILRHGVIGTNVLLIRVRDGQLQAALVPVTKLRSAKSGAGLDQNLIKAHSSYAIVKGEWSVENVLSSVGLDLNHLEVRDVTVR